LTAFSQTGTIVLDYSTAKQVAEDLLRGDSAAAELKVANRTLTVLETQLAVRNSEMAEMRRKQDNYLTQLGTLNEKESIYLGLNDQLTKDNRRLKVEVKILGATASVSMVIATVALLLR